MQNGKTNFVADAAPKWNVKTFHFFKIELVVLLLYFFSNLKSYWCFALKLFWLDKHILISFCMLFADKITRKGSLYCWSWINRVNTHDHNNKSGKCVIPFFRFMLIASYFLYDIDNIVRSGKKKKLLKVLLIQYCSYVHDQQSPLFLLLWKSLFNGFTYLFIYFPRNYVVSQLMVYAINIFTIWWREPVIKINFYKINCHRRDC